MHISLLKLDRELPTPCRVHPGDAGLDLHARSAAELAPGERATIPTGIAVAIPSNHAGLVLARSGLAARYGIGLVNSPGLIDAGYRGEIRVLLVNHGNERFEIARGDRIAQLVIVPVAMVDVDLVEHLDVTDRGSGGFGSSGR